MRPERTIKFSKKFSQKFGFDWMAIIAIITKLFENCQPSSAQVKNPGLMAQFVCVNCVQDEFDHLSRRDARKIAKNLMADAAAEPDEDIEGVCMECQNIASWE